MAVFGFVFSLLSLKVAHSSQHRPLGFAKRCMAVMLYPLVFGILRLGTALASLLGPQLRRPVHRDLALSKETTDAVVRACKRQGVSVTSAFHAGLISATQKTQSSAGEVGTSYVQFTTVDLRRFFPSTFSPHRGQGAASLQTAVPMAVGGLSKAENASFGALAKTLHERYKTPFAFADGDFGYLAPLMAMSEQMLRSGMPPPPSRTPSVSSIGVVDAFLAPRYGDWETGSEFWMSSTMQNSDIQLYLWTWKGRMVFSACYNEACYGSGEVDALLERTRSEVVHGLGIASLGD